MSNQGELAAVEAVDGMDTWEVVAVEAAANTLSDVIGEVVAVEASVPRAPPPPDALYRSYEYYMDGGDRLMGRLHLDPVLKKCSWTSHLTGNTTAWHGEYHFSQRQLSMFFFRL